MTLEAKIENPITLKLSKKENALVSDEERLPLENGAVFGNDHFGFHIVVERDGKETTETYATQCRIYGTQINNEQLYVFEDHKYLPWKFSLDGTLLSYAVFSELKKDEMEYVRETYGVKSEEDLSKLNNYRKGIKR